MLVLRSRLQSPVFLDASQEDTDCQSASLVSVLVDSLLARLHMMFPEVTSFSIQSVGGWLHAGGRRGGRLAWGYSH